jgi:hypothetical protein
MTITTTTAAEAEAGAAYVRSVRELRAAESAFDNAVNFGCKLLPAPEAARVIIPKLERVTAARVAADSAREACVTAQADARTAEYRADVKRENQRHARALVRIARRYGRSAK